MPNKTRLLSGTKKQIRSSENPPIGGFSYALKGSTSSWFRAGGVSRQTEYINLWAMPERKEVKTMAKITITGDAVVVKSTLTLKDIETVEKYRPEALVLMGGDDGKEPIFAIGTTDGCGSINTMGASFGRETHDEGKFACITMIFGCQAEGDIKEWVADKIGRAVMHLNKLEEQIPAVLGEIAAEKAEILESITVSE